MEFVIRRKVARPSLTTLKTNKEEEEEEKEEEEEGEGEEFEKVYISVSVMKNHCSLYSLLNYTSWS